MAESSSEAVRDCISGLAVSDALTREQAARELFRIGCAAAEPVLKRWFGVPDFRALAAGGSSLLTVGLAVEPAVFDTIRARSGNPHLADVPPDQDAKEFEIEFAHGVRLDILTTRDHAGGGAISRFLQRFGEGIQQVECDVRDVDRATDLLRRHFSLEPLYPHTRPGANGTRVNFFLVPAADNRKILIELVEVAAAPRKQRR